MANTSRFEKTVTRCLLCAVRRRRTVWLTLAVLLAPAVAVLLRTHFSADVTALLPPDSESGRGFALLRKCGLTETVRIEFDCPDGVERAVPALDHAAAVLARHPEVRCVDFRYFSDAAGDPAQNLAKLAPWFAMPPRPDKIDWEGQAKLLRRMLCSPAGGPMLLWTRDWTGSFRSVLTELERLRRLSGIAFRSGYAFPMSADGRYSVMRLELAASCTDPVRAAAALDGLSASLVQVLPGSIRFRIHAPHRHTIANSRLLKRDIQLATWGALLVLTGVFFVLYRGRCSSLWIVVLPLPAALFALGIMALFYDHIYLFVIGLGGGVAGIAVDQGIHVYAANQSVMGIRRTARLFGPLLLGGLTSVGVFALLWFSDIPGYQQMGWFAGGALFINLVFSLFLLPGLIRNRSFRPLPDALVRWAEPRGAPRRVRWYVFLLPAAFGALLWSGVRSDFSAEAFDGTPETVLREEKDFQARWRGGDPPDMILLEAASRDEALAAGGRVAKELLAQGVEAVGAGSFYPGSSEVMRRRAAWREWIRTGGLDRASARWSAVLKGCGAPPDWSREWEENWRRTAFSDDPPVEPECLAPILNQLVRQTDDGRYIAMVLFPESADNRAAARRIAGTIPGAAVLSPHRFGAILAGDWCVRLAGLLAAAFGGVMLAAWGYFRSFRLALLALVPVLTMLAGVGMALRLTDLKLNLIAALAGVILAGLTIDYGVFAVSALNKPEAAGNLRKAMAASALTTIAATGILLFARHPVLFQTGVMLCSGVAAAAFGALCLVPGLARAGCSGRKIPMILLGFGAVVWLTGCRSAEQFEEALEPLALTEAEARAELAAWREKEPPELRLRWRGVMELDGYRLPMLLVGKRSNREGTMELAVLTPLGVKMYELAGRDFGMVERYELSAFLRHLNADETAGTLYRDCEALFGGNHPEVPRSAVLRMEPEYVALTLPDRRGCAVDYYFAGRPLRLVRKTSRDFRGRRWQADYPSGAWRADRAGYWHTELCRYRNFRIGYRQELRREGEQE